jgi:hypothetical protein
LTSSSFLIGDNSNQQHQQQESPALLKYLHNIIQILNNDRINGNETEKAYIKSLIQRADNNGHTVKTVNGVTSPRNQQIQQSLFNRHDSGAIQKNVQH